nr:phytochrome-like protein cph2 [Actinomycetota bacterium]
ERTGARVLAEGIETEDHLRTALSLGATLGQGWFFGRPAPLPAELPFVPPWMSIPLIGTGHPIHETHTPFELLHSSRNILEADAHILLSMSRHLEDWGARLGPRGVILAALQDATRATPSTRARYAAVAATGAFVGVVGEGMSRVDIEGVATADLEPHDRLRREWCVAVLGPHFSAALSARELDPSSSARRFAFGVTHNRELVVRMAGSMLYRLEQGIHH